MNIGKKLYNLRKKSKKTLKETSEILNVTINTIYRWEHDLTIPRKGILQKMADYYQVSFDWLLSNDSGKDTNECYYCTSNAQNNLEQQLLAMFKELSEENKYRVLGYIERIYVEDMHKTGQSDI